MTRAVPVLAALLALACSAVPLPRRSVYHRSDADLSVTRIVHGSLIIEMASTRVLVDPWFDSGLVTRQKEPLGITPDGLPSFAAVLLTHGHADHFDAGFLRTIAAGVPEVIAPGALHDRLERLGLQHVTDLGWWEKTAVGPIEVTAVPAMHGVPENGYVLAARGTTAYLAGDTRWFPQLVDVATVFPALDAALLPVGGCRVVGFRREMGPSDAARAAALLKPHRIVPIGYGASGIWPIHWNARKPIERFIAACKARGIEPGHVVVLEPGESWHYYRAP